MTKVTFDLIFDENNKSEFDAREFLSLALGELYDKYQISSLVYDNLQIEENNG